MHRLSLRRALAPSVLLAIGLFVGSLVGGTALAAVTFSDVGPTHPFRNEIGWLTEHGIANGYPDGTFRGGDPVSRQAMAAFLARANSAIYLAQADTDPPIGVRFAGEATCRPGDRALAGGGWINYGEITIAESYPLNTDTWHIGFESDGDAIKDPSILRVWVLCAPKPLQTTPDM